MCGQRPSFSHAAADIRDDAPLMPDSARRCQHGMDLHLVLVLLVEVYRQDWLRRLPFGSPIGI